MGGVSVHDCGVCGYKNLHLNVGNECVHVHNHCVGMNPASSILPKSLGSESTSSLLVVQLC